MSQKAAIETPYPVNMLYRSTMVMNGYGLMEVTAVGDATEIGKAARTSTETTTIKTPLDMQLHKLAAIISKVGSGVAIAAFLIFLVQVTFLRIQSCGEAPITLEWQKWCLDIL